MPDAPVVVDARGHRCPAPTLRLRRAMENLSAGETIDLLADDPLARIDVPHFLNQTGHALISVQIEDAGWRFRVRKAG